MINLIDTHFHLDFYKDHKEIYKKINELKQYTICVTNSPEVYQECQRIYFNTKYIKFALGFNPKENHSKESFGLFKNKFKGADYIGEVGLDFSRTYSDTRIEQIEIFSQKGKDNVILTIKDNGCGIKESDLIRVFEKGFTGSDRTKSKSTGMGLYLSKKICNNLGLDIDITSKHQEETTVKIIIPKSNFNHLH